MANPYYDEYEYLDEPDEWGRRIGDPEYGAPPAGAPPPSGPGPVAAPDPTPLPSGPGGRPNYLSDSLFEPWDKKFTPSKPDLGVPNLPSIPGFTPPSLPDIAPFDAPAPFAFDKKRPTFTFDKMRPTFTAPDPSKVFEDPTYRFREREGRMGLENSAGAAGLLRSGGTLKDFIKYGQQFASGEYQNIYNRDRDQHLIADSAFDKDFSQALTTHGTQVDEFDTGYRNAASEYDRRFNNLLTTWGTNRDTVFGRFDKELAGLMPGFQAKLTGYTTEAQAAQRLAEQEWEREMRMFLDEERAFRQNQEDRLAREKWEWEFGLGAAAA